MPVERQGKERHALPADIPGDRRHAVPGHGSSAESLDVDPSVHELVQELFAGFLLLRQLRVSDVTGSNDQHHIHHYPRHSQSLHIRMQAVRSVESVLHTAGAQTGDSSLDSVHHIQHPPLLRVLRGHAIQPGHKTERHEELPNDTDAKPDIRVRLRQRPLLYSDVSRAACYADHT